MVMVGGRCKGMRVEEMEGKEERESKYTREEVRRVRERMTVEERGEERKN